MNARDKTFTPLRNLIAIHLDAVGENPADKIAKAVGKGDYPSVVIKELNAMRTDGLVECEQRGKKKEMAYWLSVPLEQVIGSDSPASEIASDVPIGNLPDGIREGTRAAQVWRALPPAGEAPVSGREIASRTKCAIGLIAPVLTTMHQRNQVARVSESSEGYLYTRPAVPPAGCKASVVNEPHAPESHPAERRLTDEAELERSDFIREHGPEGNCSCHISPPCGSCTHPGNPLNQNEDDSCWTPVAVDVIPPPQYDPDAVSFDPAKRAGAEKGRADSAEKDAAGLMSVIYDIRCAIGDPLGKIMLGDLAQQISEALQLSEAHRQDVMAREHQIETAAEWLAEVVEGGEIEPCEMDIKELAMRASGELRNARAMIEKREQQLVSHEQAIGEIHRACADAGIPEGHVAERVRKLAEMVCTLRMTTNALAEDPAVDLQDAATGYLIRVPKRRPRVVTKPETARAAALAAAKVAGRAEVMALVPVGRAVRGAEWRDA